MRSTPPIGVYVETDVTLDWGELGAELATQGSDDQAGFLLELANRLRGSNRNTVGEGLMQIQYISDEIDSYEEDSDREAIAWLVEELHLRLRERAVSE